jgi:hypothetical protein
MRMRCMRSDAEFQMRNCRWSFRHIQDMDNFFRFLRVPCGAWGLLRLPVCCVGVVFPENACQSSCSGARDARRFSILGRLESGLQGISPLNRDFAWWGGGGTDAALDMVAGGLRHAALDCSFRSFMAWCLA